MTGCRFAFHVVVLVVVAVYKFHGSMASTGLSGVQKGPSGLHNGEEEGEAMELQQLYAAWKDRMTPIIKQAAVVRRCPIPC